MIKEPSLYVSLSVHREQIAELEAENKRLRSVSVSAWNEMRDMATRLNWENIPQSYVDAMVNLKFPETLDIQNEIA
jgi:glutaredoxin-related protein